MMVFGPDGDIQIGCGITAMDTGVLTRGGTAIIIIGPGHSLFMEECMIRSTLFGDIMTPFTTDMDMDMLMATTHGGGLITPGIIIVHMEGTLIQMCPLLVVEEVQEI